MQLLQDIHEQIWLHSVPRQLRHQQVPLRLWRQLFWDVQELCHKLWKWQVQDGLLRSQCWHMHQLRLVWPRHIPLQLQRSQRGLLPWMRKQVSAWLGIFKTTNSNSNSFNHTCLAFTCSHCIHVLPPFHFVHPDIIFLQLLQDNHKRIWLYSVPRKLWRWQVPLRLWWQLLWVVRELRHKLWKRKVQIRLLRP